MNSAVSKELKEWREIFGRELKSHLRTLQADDDIYGFTLALPENFRELHIVTGVARESQLKGETAGSTYWLNRRYCPDWDFIGNMNVFPESSGMLSKILSDYEATFSTHSESREIRCRDEFHATCLDVMSRCVNNGDFGNIWFRMLHISDSNLRIVRASFYRLNSGRALKEGAKIYPRFQWLRERIAVVVTPIRIRYTRWKVGAKR
jgi:hypothetical protein